MREFQIPMTALKAAILFTSDDSRERALQSVHLRTIDEHRYLEACDSHGAIRIPVPAGDPADENGEWPEGLLIHGGVIAEAIKGMKARDSIYVRQDDVGKWMLFKPGSFFPFTPEDETYPPLDPIWSGVEQKRGVREVWWMGVPQIERMAKAAKALDLGAVAWRTASQNEMTATEVRLGNAPYVRILQMPVKPMDDPFGLEAIGPDPLADAEESTQELAEAVGHNR
jgi:hypothetical protein